MSSRKNHKALNILFRNINIATSYHSRKFTIKFVKGQIFDIQYMVCQEKMYTVNGYLNPPFYSRCINIFNFKVWHDFMTYNHLLSFQTILITGFPER